jgi:hypothetical protein
MPIAESPSLLLRQVDKAEGVETALRLFTTSGWPPELVAGWSSSDLLFELYDPADPRPLGAAIVQAQGVGCFELLAWATAVGLVGSDSSTRLLRGVADALRAVGAERFVVAVGEGQIEHLTGLRRAGFRFDRVERDAASDDVGDSGNGSGDLVWMDQEL